MSSHNDPVVITHAKRTAIGNFMGGLSGVPAYELGAHVIKNLIEESGIAADDVDEVILGQVLTALQGQNPARQAAIAAGVPESKTAFCINQVCGSGLRAVALAMQSVLLGDADIIIAGGQENMSMAPHGANMRRGVKFGDTKLEDTMIKDGLWDAFNDYHMGITAENLADKYSVTREAQDDFSAGSQQKTQAAMDSGKFKDEIVPYTISSRKGDVVIDTDEFPRRDVTAEGLAALRPAFKKDGSVTAANASGLNDSAAAVILMRKSEAEKRGLPILAVIKSWASAGVDPAIMGIGPVPAVEKALKKAQWNLSDLELVEANEAFAVQSLCVVSELGLDADIVNVNGGAISLGHPIGASGARILVTLLHEMKRRDVSKGLATLCIGGGMGVAMCVERS